MEKIRKNWLRILAAGLIVLGVIGLTGCGGGGETQQTVQRITPTETMIAAKASKPLIQVGYTELELGVATIEDLINAGAIFEADSTLQSIDYSEDPYVERDLVFDIGATQLFVHVVNPKNKITLLKESIITRVYFQGYQACGIGGIMLDDSLEVMQQKLGPEFMLVNSEEYHYETGGASMTSNGRVYTYVSQLDDITVSVCVDRNSYTVTMIEEAVPKNIITEPKMVPEKELKEISKQFKQERKGVQVSAALMDAKVKDNEQLPSGIVSGLRFSRFRVLTLNKIHDPLKFYKNKYSMYDQAVASSYLVIEYTATLTLNAGTAEKTRQDCYGCLYIPGAYINYKGEIVSDIISQKYIELSGVYSSEDEMLKALFPDKSQGYTLADFTSMDSAM